MTTTLSVDPILEIGQSFWKAKALMSAVELDLFTMLASDGPLGVDAICQRAGLSQCKSGACQLASRARASRCPRP